MKFLNSTVLFNAPPGLGIGIQDAPLFGVSSGELRDAQGVPTYRNVIDPIDWEVLGWALKKYQTGSWIVVDIEGCENRYGVHESYPHDRNVKGFSEWVKLITAIKTVRPDLLISANIAWHSSDGESYNFQTPWPEVSACTNLFTSQLLPLLDSVAIEVYYIDWPTPPAHATVPNTSDFAFNRLGDNSLRWGFRDHIHAQMNWSYAVSGKPPILIFDIATGNRSRNEGMPLSGDQMKECLDLVNMYNPAAVMLWGTAELSLPAHKYPDGFTVGSFDPKAPWLAEVKKRMTVTK